MSNQHLFAVGSEGVVIDTPAIPGDYPHGEEAGGGGCGTRPACGWVAAAVTAGGNGISPLLGAELKSPDFSSPAGAPVSALKLGFVILEGMMVGGVGIRAWSRIAPC